MENLIQEGDVLERCGVVTKRGKIIECENIAEDKEKGFEIPPEEMLKYEGKIKATWHTHPQGLANLSEKDYYGFSMWPDLKHYIIGTDGVRGYVLKDGLIYNED
jgi:proteasome lid subunit RPN8/RPN11